MQKSYGRKRTEVSRSIECRDQMPQNQTTEKQIFIIRLPVSFRMDDMFYFRIYLRESHTGAAEKVDVLGGRIEMGFTLVRATFLKTEQSEDPIRGKVSERFH